MSNLADFFKQPVASAAVLLIVVLTPHELTSKIMPILPSMNPF
jgi:hypothetical protein